MTAKGKKSLSRYLKGGAKPIDRDHEECMLQYTIVVQCACTTCKRNQVKMLQSTALVNNDHFYPSMKSHVALPLQLVFPPLSSSAFPNFKNKPMSQNYKLLLKHCFQIWHELWAARVFCAKSQTSPHKVHIYPPVWQNASLRINKSPRWVKSFVVWQSPTANSMHLIDSLFFFSLKTNKQR